MLIASYNEAQFTFYNIGFFSICEHNNATADASPTHLKAQEYKDFIEEIVVGQRSVCECDLRLLSFDVCDNTTDLTPIMVDLLLNTSKAIPYLSRPISESSLAIVYTYLPPRMTSLVDDFFSFTKACVHFFKMVRLPSGMLASSRFVEYTRHLLSVVNHFSWEDIFLVSVSKDDDILPYGVYYETSVEVSKDEHKCLQVQSLSLAQVASMNKSLDESWLRGHPNPAVILIGRSEYEKGLYLKLQKLYNDIGLQILIHDFQIYHYTNWEFPQLPEIVLSLTEIKRFQYKDVTKENLPISKKLLQQILNMTVHVRFELDEIIRNSFLINSHFVFNSPDKLHWDYDYKLAYVNKWLNGWKHIQDVYGVYHILVFKTSVK